MSVHYRKQELVYATESVEIQRDHMNARVQWDISWPVMASHVLVSLVVCHYLVQSHLVQCHLSYCYVVHYHLVQLTVGPIASWSNRQLGHC